MTSWTPETDLPAGVEDLCKVTKNMWGETGCHDTEKREEVLMYLLAKFSQVPPDMCGLAAPAFPPPPGG
eukprot:CAMPEP_0179149326 /NCGR_PEP_ID=MMETSP0796-20121207/72332_1 /TAXON_ID=73915 /ORGANISM="Pyrodinium bahamense, Strain pbaha01" /LENGTH=68 /DNA_ID=CAMNT_0020850153 /DNA_START=14 /DNA_END=217 /DNA_ORIENTATION=-